MKRNMADIDRTIRALLAVAAVATGASLGGAAAIALYAFAGVMALTAAITFCPLYRLLGIDTCQMTKGCAAKTEA